MEDKIRVLLITSRSSDGAPKFPPLGVYRLKNHLENHFVRCTVHDPGIDGEDMLLKKEGFGYFDVVGMSVTHIRMEKDLDRIAKIREAMKRGDSHAVIIVGGQAATMNAGQWLESGLVDIVFLGFAEDALRDFCTGFSSLPREKRDAPHAKRIARDIPGVAFLSSEGNLIFNPSIPLTPEGFRRMSFQNVRDADIPYRKYFEHYKKSVQGILRHTDFVETSSMSLFTTTHCQGRCGFCSSHAFLPEAQRKAFPTQMLDAQDILELVLGNIRPEDEEILVLICDDDFLSGSRKGIERAEKFCDIVNRAKRSGLLKKDVKFFCQSRVSNFLSRGSLRRELMESMKEAGFSMIGLGVETFSDILLRSPSVNKGGITTAEVSKVLDELLSIGIIPNIFLILGIPESTVEDLIETMRAAVLFIQKGAGARINARMDAHPGSPVVRSGRYEFEMRRWKNPINGKTLEIRGHVIPTDEKIRHMVNHLWETSEKEKEFIRQQRGYREVYSRSLDAMATFIAAAKLVGRYDVADEFARVTEAMPSDVLVY